MPADTRQRLIEAMSELSARNGFHAIGLDRLLDHVGISKQTFYNHFESKDELTLETIRFRDALETKSFVDLLEREAGPDPRAQLLGVFNVLDAWFNDPAFNGCIFMTAAAEFPMQTDPIHTAAARHLQQLEQKFCHLAAAAGARQPLVLAQRMLMLVEGALVVRHIMGNTSSARIARATAAALMEQHFVESSDAA